jgi:hypothetical protein
MSSGPCGSAAAWVARSGLAARMIFNPGRTERTQAVPIVSGVLASFHLKNERTLTPRASDVCASVW